MPTVAHKSKSKKDKKIKSFSPISFQALPIEWSPSELDIINDFKKKYKFDVHYDLIGHLAEIDAGIKAFKECDRQRPTEKETIDYFKKIKKKTSQSISSLEKIKTLLPLRAKKIMGELKDLFEIMGSRHVRLITSNTPGGFTTINELRKILDILCDESYLDDFKINLRGILYGVEILRSSLPTPKSGRKKVDLEKSIIYKLINIYADGTRQHAKCHWDPIKNQYAGKFYEFLMEAINILKEEIKIKPLDKKTWGDYAREVVNQYGENNRKTITRQF